MTYLTSIVVVSIFAYFVMLCLYVAIEKKSGLKNGLFLLSFLTWIISIISYFQAGILAEKHQVMGQVTFGDAFLSLLALVLLGKLLFYPSNHENKKEEEEPFYLQESNSY